MFIKKTFDNIRITQTNNGGYIVNVGCCMMGYSNIKHLLDDLKTFLEDPKGTKEYYHSSGRKEENIEVLDSNKYNHETQVEEACDNTGNCDYL